MRLQPLITNQDGFGRATKVRALKGLHYCISNIEHRRTKLAHDPNNTRWTGNTESFGLKLMTAQGWQPGDYLGAKDAKQAEHYTAGSASHIRILIKDDNLGLGAKIGSGVGHGECTGLDAFKDLLGRLNGKEEDEIEKEKKSREDLKRAIYSERKWGSTRFVRGGFLIGDKIQPLIEAEAERIRKLADNPSETVEETVGTSGSSDSDEESPLVEKPKKSKKRKLEDAETVADVVAIKSKKSKKSKARSKDSKQKTEEDDATKNKDEEAKKESKKDRKLGRGREVTDEEKRRRKKEKKSKKAKKEEAVTKERSPTEKTKSKPESSQDDTTESSESSIIKAPNIASPITSVPSSGYSTPMMQGRHAVRSRNIAQKRLASMDVTSLNQVSLWLYFPVYEYACKGR